MSADSKLEWRQDSGREYRVDIGEPGDWIRFDLTVFYDSHGKRWWAYAVGKLGYNTCGFDVPGPIEGRYWATPKAAQSAAVKAVAKAADKLRQQVDLVTLVQK